METLQIQRLNDGRAMISCPFCVSNLPPVRSTDLQAAWETASIASENNLKTTENDPDGVIFETKLRQPIDFEFDDYDALCWATAIHRSYDLTTLRGLSLCFRMLALYQLMAKNAWSRGLFSFDRSNTLKIDKGLLAAAAVTNLGEDGAFDAEEIRNQTGTARMLTSNEALGLQRVSNHRPKIDHTKQAKKSE